MSCLGVNRQGEEIPGRNIINARGVLRMVGHWFVLTGIYYALRGGKLGHGLEKDTEAGAWMWTGQSSSWVSTGLRLQASVGNSHGNGAQGGSYESLLVPFLAQHTSAKQIKLIQQIFMELRLCAWHPVRCWV